MFKCHICGNSITSNTPAKRIVLETREHVFPPRKKVHLIPEHKRSKKKTAPDYADDPGGKGTQIVREALVCPECAAKTRI